MKIALLHDSLTQMGGAEKVLHHCHELFPSAPVYALVFDKKLHQYFQGWNIKTSRLQYLYNIVPSFPALLPFIPLALKGLDLRGFDVVFSDSSTFIKNLTMPKGVVHITYCHTPARFLWANQDSYLKAEVPSVIRPLVKLYLKWMKKWDYKMSQKPDYYIANAVNIQRQIKLSYNRDSKVIYPPVDVSSFYPTTPKKDFYLTAGRLQGHKSAQLVINAFNESGKQLHIVGTGRQLPYLKSIANKNITFLGRVTDEELRNEYSSAKALIFPQEEDFGLMPLEAMSCGTPVIAFGKGGALETVIDRVTGLFFTEQTVESLQNAIIEFEKLNFSQQDMFEQAKKFNVQKFKHEILAFITDKVK